MYIFNPSSRSSSDGEVRPLPLAQRPLASLSAKQVATLDLRSL